LDHVLEHDLVERQVRDQPLQLGDFVTELLQLAGLTGLQTAVDVLPAVEALLRDARPAQRSPTGTPWAACCNTAVICSTEKRFFTALLLPFGAIVPQSDPGFGLKNRSVIVVAALSLLGG
jgi:hypothetical protein